MKIATFNVNNINKRLANILRWLKEAEPDVACLQELKAADNEFPVSALKSAGYWAVWSGQRSWNGVAILARGREPVLTRRGLPGDPGDLQSRYIEAAVNGVLVASLYAPNGNPHPGPKFRYKLAWLDRLARHARKLRAADIPVVLAGDYNVVPTERDIYPNHSYGDDALLQPESRARFQRFVQSGWLDAVRALHPDERMYTYWSYLRNRWPRDAGLRIDHLLLSPIASKRLTDAGTDRSVRDAIGASDHCPVWAILKSAPSSGALAFSRTSALRSSSGLTRRRRRSRTAYQRGSARPLS